MIIGVDAGALSISDERLRVGVWRITYNLLNELGKLDTQNTYRLYTFSPLDEDFGPRMKNIVLQKRGYFSLWLPLELRRHPVDVFLGLSQALPTTRAKNIGFVYDLGFLHHPEAYPGSQIKLRKQTQELIKRAHHIVAISESTRLDIEKTYSVSTKNITVSYPGIDSRFTPEGKAYKGAHPYFLFVGALKRGKNIPFAIRAYSQILKNLRIVYDFLIIGGDYWMDPEIKETIEKLHLTDRVKLLGFVPDADIPKYYRGATALVMPSLWEGFCLPVVEAMASGCPIVATKVGALPEIIGESGILVSPGNLSELATAMERVIKEPTKEKLKEAGLVNAKRFSWHTMAKAVLSLF